MCFGTVTCSRIQLFQVRFQVPFAKEVIVGIVLNTKSLNRFY